MSWIKWLLKLSTSNSADNARENDFEDHFVGPEDEYELWEDEESWGDQ